MAMREARRAASVSASGTHKLRIGFAANCASRSTFLPVLLRANIISQLNAASGRRLSAKMGWKMVGGDHGHAQFISAVLVALFLVAAVAQAQPIVSTLTGSGTYGFADGAATAARFAAPRGVAVSPGTGAVYVADRGNNKIRVRGSEVMIPRDADGVR